MRQGIYSWTVLAYDLDNNVRFAEAIKFFRNRFTPKIFASSKPPVTGAYVNKDMFDLELNNTAKVKPYRPDINFQHDKDELTSAAKREMDILAAALLKPDLARVFVKLGGHTDQSGPALYNRNLSARRVASVRKYFVDNHGIDGNRVFAKGYGEKYPLEDAYQFSGTERKQNSCR